MNDVCTFQIRLQGDTNEDEMNAMCPVSVTVEQVDASSTILAVRADQAGLIGLLRHLHGLGFVILSLARAEKA
jgi:hypothetical protein